MRWAFAKWHVEHDGAPGSASYRAFGSNPAGSRRLPTTCSIKIKSAEIDGLPVPVLDALVREFIESHFDLAIQRAVVQADPKMRAEVVAPISGTLQRMTTKSIPPIPARIGRVEALVADLAQDASRLDEGGVDDVELASQFLPERLVTVQLGGAHRTKDDFDIRLTFALWVAPWCALPWARQRKRD